MSNKNNAIQAIRGFNDTLPYDHKSKCKTAICPGISAEGF